MWADGVVTTQELVDVHHTAKTFFLRKEPRNALHSSGELPFLHGERAEWAQAMSGKGSMLQ